MVKMVSWKNTFEILIRERDLVNKKKQALDSLLSSGRISKSTYDYINEEISGTLKDIEDLTAKVQEKMKARLDDLEKQKELLERFIASLELYHAAEEIDEISYEKQREALNLGLESTTSEISEISEALVKLSPKEQESAPQESVAQYEEYQSETSEVESGEAEATIEGGIY
ncbi:hypothetical protein CW709_00815 [Candidatus Bathyarchaeota archaeon]|nr:MAG: hypothetical protein CW709_00815 [Candidatus Bathyarchaeota archaeon]